MKWGCCMRKSGTPMVGGRYTDRTAQSRTELYVHADSPANVIVRPCSAATRSPPRCSNSRTSPGRGLWHGSQRQALCWTGQPVWRRRGRLLLDARPRQQRLIAGAHAAHWVQAVEGGLVGRKAGRRFGLSAPSTLLYYLPGWALYLHSHMRAKAVRFASLSAEMVGTVGTL